MRKQIMRRNNCVLYAAQDCSGCAPKPRCTRPNDAFRCDISTSMRPPDDRPHQGRSEPHATMAMCCSEVDPARGTTRTGLLVGLSAAPPS